MSTALADLLIDLSDPKSLKTFEENPEAMMEARNLTELDRAALRSRVPGWIRHQASKVKDTPGEDLLYTTMGPALDVIDVIDVVDVVVVL